MEKLKLGEVAAALGCAYDGDAEITSISTDTRKIEPGALFVALKGANFDGHDYIEQALRDGAVAAVSHKDISADGVILRVEDTGRALLKLGQFYRNRFDLTLCGVTGSVGKTSTKEMIYAVLQKKHKTLKTQGNLNNEIGLPTTLFGLDSSYTAAVIEMGMSHFGEIERLSCTAQPDIGVITNVGVSHIENLGDRAGILKAKLEIRKGLKGKHPLIINIDNDMLRQVHANESIPTLGYGIENPDAAVRAVKIEQNLTTTFAILYNGAEYPAEIPTVGVHNVYNALAAFCVGLQCGMEIEDIIAGLLDYKTAGMRQNIVSYGGVTVVEDCYNASPDSMQASLNVLRDLQTADGGKRVAVLGDMLELGDYAEKLHHEVGTYAADCADMILCYGAQSKHTAAGALQAGQKAVAHFVDKDTLTAFIKHNVKPGDVILFKASRGMKLEDVIQKAYKES